MSIVDCQQKISPLVSLPAIQVWVYHQYIIAIKSNWHSCETNLSCASNYDFTRLPSSQPGFDINDVPEFKGFIIGTSNQ